MGDTIMFRGRQRFVVQCVRGLVLERVLGSRSPVAYYSVSAREIQTIVVVKRGTPATRRRARELLKRSCLPHTRIEWNGDRPIYVHTVAGVTYRNQMT